MRKIRYTGNADVRRVRRADFERNDIKNQEDVIFDSTNEYIVEVKNETAEFLVGIDGFENLDETDEADEEDEDASTDDTSSKAAPSGTTTPTTTGSGSTRTSTT